MTTQPPPESAETGLTSYDPETGFSYCVMRSVPAGQPPPESGRCNRCKLTYIDGRVCSASGFTLLCNEPAPVATDTQARECPNKVCHQYLLVGARCHCGFTATPAPAGDAEVCPKCNEPLINGKHARPPCMVEAHEEAFETFIRRASAESPAEVSHEDAAALIWEIEFLFPGRLDCQRSMLRRYISQQEARQQQAEREVAELRASCDHYREDRRVQRVRATDAEIALTEERSLTAELRGKLDAAKRERDHHKASVMAYEKLVDEFSDWCRENEPVAFNVFQHGINNAKVPEQSPPSQPPPANPLTPDDVRTIAREVIAEVAERACVACAADGRGDGSGYPLGRLAEAAKE